MRKEIKAVVTDEMLAAGRRVVGWEEDCPSDELMVRIYFAMRALEHKTEGAADE